MVLIESSESEDEINIKDEVKPSSSSLHQPVTTDATEPKSVYGDDSDGFATVTSDEEPQNSDKPENKEEQIEQMREGEDIVHDGSNKEKAMEEANEAKVEGNRLFVSGLYEEALSKYVLALEFLQEFHESIELRSICYLNRGVCFLKLGKYEETIKECTKALELNPTYTKALVRRAEAHEKLEHFEEAVTDLKKILELDPSNDQARKGIRRLEPLAAQKLEN